VIPAVVAVNLAAVATPAVLAIPAVVATPAVAVVIVSLLISPRDKLLL
jgi:hypothetical protein